MDRASLTTVRRGASDSASPNGGAIEPVQLGAFLLVLRYRTETPVELADCVRAARARIADGNAISVDLDWPSYADRHEQLPPSFWRRCCWPRAACAC